MVRRFGDTERSPGARMLFAALAAMALVIPLFTVYLLVYDRQSQSKTAQASIVQGWGRPQLIDGPVLVIPYWEDSTQTITEKGRTIVKPVRTERELVIAPDTATLDTRMRPQRLKRSIYQAVVYEAENSGHARFAMPAALARLGIAVDQLALDRAELRFGFSDARGLFGPRPVVSANGRSLNPETGRSSSNGGAGFHSLIDATALPSTPIDIDYRYALRGNASLTLVPQAGDTRWIVRSPWQNPSFTGDFLPASHPQSAKGFVATWQIGNLALGRPLVSIGDSDRPGSATSDALLTLPYSDPDRTAGGARVELITPVDLYDQINRSVKYGFLFIGFTFAALLMFDVVGGVRVSAIEYLLVGMALVLFFVMLLAFSEVVGFATAYAGAAAAIIALITAYAASVLKSWRRAQAIGLMLIGLYGVLYVLLSLEAYALVVGSLLLFVALAMVMYLTRHLDWSGREEEAATSG